MKFDRVAYHPIEYTVRPAALKDGKIYFYEKGYGYTIEETQIPIKVFDMRDVHFNTMSILAKAKEIIEEELDKRKGRE